MITHIELQWQLPPQEPFRQNLAYTLYGMLCGQMAPDLADVLHQQEITPIRQHVEKGADGRCLWVVDLFGPAQELTGTLCGLRQIELNGFSAPCPVQRCTATTVSDVPALLTARDDIPTDGGVQMEFKTPCTFKVAGRYAQFPSAELIAQSLFLRWNALMPDCTLEDADALHLLSAGLSLRSYRLASRPYRFKGQTVVGFTGSVELSARLPAPMMELWRLLLAFAPYAGVGVKPALGMGAVGVTPVPRH